MKWSAEPRGEYIVPMADDVWQVHCLGGDPPEPVVRCRDCRHATMNGFGQCKYCEKFWLPDVDGYGADPEVRLPGDFFCAYGERKGES